MRLVTPGLGRKSIGLLLSSLALLASPHSNAFDLALEDTNPGWRLSAGADVFRAPGSVVAGARYGGSLGARLAAWAYTSSKAGQTPPDVLIGVDYVLTRKKWQAGIGIAWIDEVNLMNGTRWNLDMMLAYQLSDRVFVEFRHQSHAAILGVKTDAPNGSWNILSLGWYLGRAADAGSRGAIETSR